MPGTHYAFLGSAVSVRQAAFSIGKAGKEEEEETFEENKHPCRGVRLSVLLSTFQCLR